VKIIVDKLREGIMSGAVVGSFVYKIGEQSVIYTHSGLRPEYLNYLKKKIGSTAPDDIVAHINGLLFNAVKNCKSYQCSLEDETFEAGEDRGGSRELNYQYVLTALNYFIFLRLDIGGPFWTDFSVITEASHRNQYSKNDMIQG
jgi:hypothetical protein